MRRYLRAVRQYSSSWGTGRFLRVKAILSAAVVKVPRVPAYVLLCTPPSKTISTSLAAAREEEEEGGMACRGGHHSGGGLRGTIACPVSRRGIARDISSPLTLPLIEESAQLPQMTIAATSRSPRRFNTKSTPPAILHQPPSLASVSSSHVMPRLRRWNDKRI